MEGPWRVMEGPWRAHRGPIEGPWRVHGRSMEWGVRGGSHGNVRLLGIATPWWECFNCSLKDSSIKTQKVQDIVNIKSTHFKVV